MTRQINFDEGNIDIFNINFVMQPAFEQVYLNELFFQKLGDDGKSVLYDFGKNCAIEMNDQIFNKFKVDGTESLNLWQSIIELSGNAKINSITNRDGRIVILAKSTLAQKLKEKNSKIIESKADYFLSGFFSGAFSKIYGKNLYCRETKCMVEGEATCTFILEKN